ncbi:MAG: ParB N-terminal domain-containing protein [Roseibium sp.]|uniref:ParB N-terminal domain-containing protein n=1 Tax=Roseibium sp. TaxID=1936156 RepID=UPI00329A00CE
MRDINIGDEVITPMADKKMPELAWVEIDGLQVDDRYQRELGVKNWTRIRKIAQEFRWSRFSPILVAPIEGGGYAIVDGQHRAHAAKMRNIKKVPALIVEMDETEQARSFSWVNDQVTRISAFHIYKAALAAGDAWAVQSRDAVEAAGCKLMTCNKSTNQKKSGEIFTMALVRGMIEKKQAKVVTGGLAALRGYDTTDRVALYSGIILKPWLSALAEKPKFLSLDLVAFLNEHDPYRILNRIDLMRKEEGLQGKTPAKLERDAFISLLDAYAKSQRKAHQKAA